MRLEPLNILLNQNLKLDKKFYFISGNEITLMEKITGSITEKYKKNENVKVERIDDLNSFIDEGGLFENKKVFLCKNCKGIEEIFDKLRKTNDIFIFFCENKQSIKKTKNIFLKNRESFLIDCYELDRNSKVRILNYFLELSKINLKKEIYWFLIDKLDNRYVFFENSLIKIQSLNKKNIELNDVRKLLAKDGSGKEKLFFNILKKNKELVSVYREKIITNSDVNEMYYYCKFFCNLIIDCSNEQECNKKIPAYLFKEKSLLLEIYKKYNSRKKKMLLELLSSTETILRRESALSLISGLRFLLSLKKITIS